MSRHKPLVLAGVALALVACDRPPRAASGAGTVTLVNRVTAQVRGDRCPTCASTLEAALRRRFDAVDVTVNLERQTVDVEFAPSTPFASRSFREAITEGGAELQRVEIEACGTIDTTDGRQWITSGSARLLLEGPGSFGTDTEVCVTGELRDLSRPPTLVISD